MIWGAALLKIELGAAEEAGRMLFHKIVLFSLYRDTKVEEC